VIAVHGGADVQVRYPLFDERVGRTVWRRTAHHVSVGQESAAGVPVVSCTFVGIPDTNYDLVDGRKFDEDPFAFEWQTFNTTGVRDRVKFEQSTRTVIQHVVDRQQIAWYVRDYRRPSVLVPIFTDVLTRWRRSFSADE
jgi:hypothetical protein